MQRTIQDNSSAVATVLVVGLPQFQPAEYPAARASFAQTGAQTLRVLRLVPFDLLLAGTRIPDMNTLDFIQTLRGVLPRQRWALVADELSDDDEIAARAMGAVAIFDAPPDGPTFAELLASLRRSTKSSRDAPQHIDTS